MRRYTINYTDKVMGRPGEVYSTNPVESSKVGRYKESLDMMGWEIVSVIPFEESS